MKGLTYFGCLLSLTILLVGCAEENQEKNNEHASDVETSPDPVTELHVPTPIFTIEEKAYIAQLKKRTLRVAVDQSKTAYLRHDDGTITGMHYELVSEFAKYIGVELEIVVVPFSDFFAKDGKLPGNVRTDPTVIYTPDILNKVDLCISGVTVTPWRQKLVQFVKLFPSKVVLISRKGEEITKLSDLKEKRVVSRKDTTYYETFLNVERETGMKFHYTFVDSSKKMFDAVAKGEADVTSRDADSTIMDLKNYPNLNISMSLFEVIHLGWTARKDNKVLVSILDKYILYSKKNGIFNRVWRNTYGVDFGDFLRVIDYE